MWIQQTRVPNSERSKCLEANDVIIVPGERALLWSAGLETLSEALRSSMPVFGHAAFVCDAVADDEDESLVRVSGRTWIPRALSHAPRPDLQSGLRGQSVFFLCPCDGSLMWGESGCTVVTSSTASWAFDPHHPTPSPSVDTKAHHNK